jgi:hypothetical protein
MSVVYATLIAASLSGSGQELGEDWQVWGSLGGRTGIYVDSKGRNVAYSDRTRRALLTDLQQGTPTSFCEDLPLSEYQVQTIAFRIFSIPSDVLDKGGLSIFGTCMDEPRDGVTLRMRGRVFHFGYSQIKSCRQGQAVPTWLTSLVTALRTRYYNIKGCGEWPVNTKEHP